MLLESTDAPQKLRPGEIAPGPIERVVALLIGAATLCDGLGYIAQESKVDPEGLDALETLIRKAANDLKQALDDAEKRT
jgi:hypothetical protein